jgi:hypothetical protein
MNKLLTVILFLVGHSLACLGKQDTKTVYFLIPPAPVNYLSSGSIVGFANDEDGPIVFAGVGDGKLPKGLYLGENGTLVVTQPELLTPGTYQFTVTTVDHNNNISQNELLVTLLEPSAPNTPSVGRVHRKKPLEAYQKGDVLAEIVDKDGKIKETKLVAGRIPKGLALSQNGKLRVHDPASLLPGTFDFLILAVDEKEQGCFLALTVSVPNLEKSPILSSDSMMMDTGK